MRSRTLRAALAALMISGMSFGAAACWGTGGGMLLETGPPAPPDEVVVVQPGPGYVWVPGYYNAVGGSYVWVSGRWTVPPAHYHTWVAPRWEHESKGWRFHEGHWKKD